MNRVLSEEAKQFIRDNFLTLSDAQMGQMLGGIAKGTIRSFRKKENIKISIEESQAKRTAAIKAHHAQTEHPLDEVIKEQYLLLPIKTLASQINRSHTYIRGRLDALGLVIPTELTNKRKEDSRLKPGNVPMNKGKKDVEHLTPESIALKAKTQFKKGGLPSNTLSDGIIRTRTHRKSGLSYQWIRISQANWKMLHVKVWEDANGPVPPEHIVIFRDGNQMNATLENLEMVSLAENMRRNSIQNYPKELKEVMRLKGKLKRTLKKIQNGRQQSN